MSCIPVSQWCFSMCIFFVFVGFCCCYCCLCVWVFCLHVYICTTYMPDAHKGQIPWNGSYRLLWAATWMLWAKLGSSWRVASAPICSANHLSSSYVKFLIVIFNYMYKRECVEVCTHERLRCPWRLEEDFRSSGDIDTRSCRMPSVSACRSQTQVLSKSSRHTYLPTEHLSDPLCAIFNAFQSFKMVFLVLGYCSW